MDYAYSTTMEVPLWTKARKSDTGKPTPLSDREKGAAQPYLPLWKR